MTSAGTWSGTGAANGQQSAVGLGKTIFRPAPQPKRSGGPGMIRDYQPEDAEQIKAIHAEMGIDYNLYELDSPLCFVKKVRAKMGCGRCDDPSHDRRDDPAGFRRPGSKGRAIEELQPEVLSEAWRQGLDDIVCVIPPEISDSFKPFGSGPDAVAEGPRGLGEYSRATA